MKIKPIGTCLIERDEFWFSFGLGVEIARWSAYKGPYWTVQMQVGPFLFGVRIYDMEKEDV